MKKTYKPFLITTSVIVLICTLIYFNYFHFYTKKLILPNKNVITVEIADNFYKQARGLSYRKQLAFNKGMLFVFDSNQKQIFWMKNTLIPLDIVWLDENLKIIGIIYDLKPCTKDQCQLYMSPEPVKYVLEVSSGFAKNMALSNGQQLILN